MDAFIYVFVQLLDNAPNLFNREEAFVYTLGKIVHCFVGVCFFHIKPFYQRRLPLSRIVLSVEIPGEAVSYGRPDMDLRRWIRDDVIYNH